MRVDRHRERLARREADLDRAQANLEKLSAQIDDEMLKLFQAPHPKTPAVVIPPSQPVASAPAAENGHASSFVPQPPVPVPSLQDLLKPSQAPASDSKPEAPKAPAPPAGNVPGNTPSPAASPKAPPPAPAPAAPPPEAPKKTIELPPVVMTGDKDGAPNGWRAAAGNFIDDLKIGFGEFFGK